MEIENLLELSVQKGASDLHVRPRSFPLLRINGNLSPIKGMNVLSAEDTQYLIDSIMTKEQREVFQTKLVCELALSISHIGNFRVSIFHQMHGVAAVFRIIPNVVPCLDTVGLPEILKSKLTLPHGLILVTGPTGSGKSTTLAAMVDYINTFQALNIVTIEDPIEFIHQAKLSVFNQLQVGRDTTDFASALRASLRQDPDVILLGELRDLETMRLALTAAETGHLVLATLHARSAPLAISRFADVFPAEEQNRVRTLLSETLQAVICQTLVKRVSGGRVAAFEVMLMTPPIRHFIRQDMPAHMESTMQTSPGKGMCTMDQALQKLVEKNLITSIVASNASLDREAFLEKKKIRSKEQMGSGLKT